MEKLIQVRNLNFGYGGGSIFSGAGFSIEAGEFVCVIGSNGTGKSTLLKLLLGILKPQSGEVILAEGCRVAYVSQQATAFNHDFPITVSETVRLGAYRSKNSAADAALALERVAMSEHADKLLGKLSGGQQQRVLIAKALAAKADIIFLDEPTTGIDHDATDAICCMLAELNKNDRLTVVMVTHDYSLVSNHATKILKLKKDGGVQVRSRRRNGDNRNAGI